MTATYVCDNTVLCRPYLFSSWFWAICQILVPAKFPPRQYLLSHICKWATYNYVHVWNACNATCCIQITLADKEHFDTALNFRGRKLSRISPISAHSRKFSSRTSRARATNIRSIVRIRKSFLREIFMLVDSQNFSPSKISCCTVQYRFHNNCCVYCFRGFAWNWSKIFTHDPYHI